MVRMPQRVAVYWEGEYCDRCGSRADIMIHHRVSQVDGGDDSRENLQPLCAACHSRQPGPGHRLCVRWRTGIVRFVGCVAPGDGEYQELRAAKRTTCAECGSAVERSGFVYVERIEFQACDACHAGVDWLDLPDEHTSRGVGHKCGICSSKAHRGDKYFTGVRRGRTICGSCIDEQFRAIRAADYQIWFGKDPPEDFDPRPTRGGLRITLGSRPTPLRSPRAKAHRSAQEDQSATTSLAAVGDDPPPLIACYPLDYPEPLACGSTVRLAWQPSHPAVTRSALHQPP